MVKKGLSTASFAELQKMQYIRKSSGSSKCKYVMPKFTPKNRLWQKSWHKSANSEGEFNVLLCVAMVWWVV